MIQSIGKQRIWDTTALVAVLMLAGGVVACRVQVNKGANGEDKNVQVDTPFSSVHVNTGETTAADLGLPAYPGAEVVKEDNDHKSADVHLGFGEWKMQVKVVSYASGDSQDKVIDFYKKALTRYGDVITCRGDAPVGTPTRTAEGLTCENDKNSNVKIDAKEFNTGKDSLELKAGSRRHQHMVGFEGPQNGKTRFSLVALDLPSASSGKSGQSD
jgi:hypothetical protein